ncbi:MAG TPA: SIMPL domain-containing protein [Dehalococcoidia bacterium]
MWIMGGMLLAPLAFVAAVCGTDTTRVENGDAPEHSISVSGEGKVSAKPDIALITLGVSTLQPTVAQARETAAASLDGMIASMKANDVAENDIQTQQLYISAEYDYNDGNQRLRGFRVNNTVVAKVRNIDNTGKVVDDAVDAGGDSTTIQGIAFTIDDPKELQSQARSAAVEDARSKAETLASAGKVDLGDPITINEGAVYLPQPVDAYKGIAADRASAGAETQVLAGELDVVVSVTVVFALK